MQEDMNKLSNIMIEEMNKIMICSECNYKHTSIAQIEICDKCGNKIGGYSKASKLMMDMADKWVELYMKYGVDESKAQKRVIKLIETIPSLPIEIIKRIEIHFEDF